MYLGFAGNVALKYPFLSQLIVKVYKFKYPRVLAASCPSSDDRKEILLKSVK